MAKTNSVYVCQECGAKSKKWVGKCENCTAWNSFVEEVVSASASGSFISNVSYTDKTLEIFDLCSYVDPSTVVRYDTGISEFDRVLGGGYVPGSVILLCGEPGIGKSTLLMQLCGSADKNGIIYSYVSGEESGIQINLRAKRLNVLPHTNVKIVIASCIEEIARFILNLSSDGPQVVIVDSVQTLYSTEIASTPGSVSQVKFCAFELIKIAKQRNITVIIVGHVTKDGQIAGPKVLEHMVDTVLYFEGEGVQQHRIIRTTKNRFGSTNEIGVFEMCGMGLIEVTNPSRLFMTTRAEEVAGSCILAGLEGTRSLLVEIQALVVYSYIPVPRRAAIGWDGNRLAMMIAILSARLGLKLMDKEIYLNVAGGLRINEPAADLAVLVSLISAAHNVKIPHSTVFFGEVGLSGELRQVTQADSRINEASKLGFKRVIMPSDNKQYHYEGVEIVQMDHIEDLLTFFSKLQKQRKHDSGHSKMA